ncbi:MAG: ribonuclease D [Flavobacteriales bacterium]|nr:ribonuclease D [Flavobacteriales bacterium]MBK6943662.1 ribonuclease D [Flavobacteriales bacterium]MBK7296918.1 ribonuclease D [Flavobacteriales bacterium]MBK9535805.1 ribonuclease D [Flavobacteriales bacterium]MBP9138716.1 ribonuclease D [Flavobacteriales bacterium]
MTRTSASPTTVPAFELITEPKALTKLTAHLAPTKVLALDTEASSFHRYKERVCLIQLSDRDHTWLVDPLLVENLDDLGKLLADPAMEIVIHDADYDLRILAKHHKIRVSNIFDTLVAAELVNEPEIGLAALLKKYKGLQIDKKFQKADWSKRPLPQDMLDYAAGDTSDLIELRDILKEELIAKGRWAWAEEEFALLTDMPFNAPTKGEPAFIRMKGAKTLKPVQLAVLREVHAWREKVAERMDRAPFMVVGNTTLLAIAVQPPSSMKELAKVAGMGDRVMERYGKAIMDAIVKGQAVPKDEWPRVERPKRYPRDDDHEERLKRLKVVREKLMVDHDLKPGIIGANQLLADIARTLPGDLEALAALPGIRNYQVANFGSELLKAL